MSTSKRPCRLVGLSVFLVMIIFLTGCSSGKSNTAPAPLNDSPSTITLFETPQDGDTPVLSQISSAQHTIDVMVYEMSSNQNPDVANTVVPALVQAAQSGVQVRVILNSNGTSSENQDAFNTLSNTPNASVKWADPYYASIHAYIHAKIILIDAGQATQKALIMTLNLAPSYMGELTPLGANSLNFGIVDSVADDISQLETMFNLEWNYQGRTYTLPQNTNLVMSPNNSFAVLKSQIQNATQSIHFFAQELEDSTIVNNLVSAAKNGIEVKGLVPSNFPFNIANANTINSNGGEVRFLDQPYQHSKATIVDGVQVYIGSINYTNTSMTQNREVGIIVTQSDIVSRMETRFSYWFSQASPTPSPTPNP